MANPWGLLAVAGGAYLAWAGTSGLALLKQRQKGLESDVTSVGKAIGSGASSVGTAIGAGAGDVKNFFAPPSAKQPPAKFTSTGPHSAKVSQPLRGSGGSGTAKAKKKAKAAFQTQPPTSVAASQALNRQNEATRSEVPNIKGL